MHAIKDTVVKLISLTEGRNLYTAAIVGSLNFIIFLDQRQIN